MTCTFGTLTRALERGGGGGTAAGSLPPLPPLALLPNSLEPLSARQNAGRLGEREHTNYENSVFAKSWQKAMSFNLELGKLGGLHPLCVRFPISFFYIFFVGELYVRIRAAIPALIRIALYTDNTVHVSLLRKGNKQCSEALGIIRFTLLNPTLSLSLFPSLSSSYSNIAKNQTCRVM